MIPVYLPAIFSMVVEQQSTFETAYQIISAGNVRDDKGALAVLGTVPVDKTVIFRSSGTKMIWYFRANPSANVALKFTNATLLPSPPTVIGSSGWVAMAIQVSDGTGTRWVASVEGNTVGSGEFEVFLQPEACKVQPNVPKGQLIKLDKIDSKVYPGIDRGIWVYVPANYASSKPASLMVFQDGQFAKNYMPTVLDNMIDKRELPQLITVFLEPGTAANGRSNRSVEYDTLTATYSNYLITEVLPVVNARWPFKTGPEFHAIAGISSGAICAFTVAWERPDMFHKVLSWVGSYVNLQGGVTGIGGGHNYPTLIRKTQGKPKPIRVFLQDGTNDLDNPYGNWPLANMEMDKAFSYSGYDYKFVLGQGFHSDNHGRALLPESLRWLWRGVPID